MFFLQRQGYRSHDKKKTHKYDSKSRLRKKAGGREKEAGGGARRGGGRASSQRPSRSHSDEEEDEGVPASYHTVSLQVSQDVSTTALFTLLPFVTVSPLTLSASLLCVVEGNCLFGSRGFVT